MEILIGLLAILVLAFIPMMIYSLILWWFDWYEREPLLLLLIAFLWGAIPAIIFSIIAQVIFGVPIYLLVGEGLGSDLFSAGLVAPLTEEPFKGLALLLLLLFFRREIDTPLDGILYGGLIGFGFAATENLFYFFSAYSMGGLVSVLGLAFLRAFVFGLNHALFTGCTGLGIALARVSPRRAVRISAPLLGLAAAILLHGIHNAGATLAELTCLPFIVSIISDFGGVLALFGILLWSSYRERKLIVEHLEPEIQSGIIGTRDYPIIQSYWKRVGKRTEALLEGDLSRWRTLGTYYRLATKLAFTKHRWETHERDQETALQIEQLRRELYELRKVL
jgi:RsiW-degrading membrane proteinase PrsW (M82 family)